MVSRLAKSAVPPNTQMARDAQWAVWKSATVFVNYLATSAAEHAGRTSKKTIQPNDIIDAVRELELPDFTTRLEAELASTIPPPRPTP
jgi:histone H3/H4